MKVFTSLDQLPSLPKPICLAIGNFDGVHIGHQAILKRVVEKAKAIHGESAALTFSNHPASILRKETPPLLCTIPHKKLLLERMGIDYLFMLPFTLEFSKQTEREFLEKMAKLMPLKWLIQGHDAMIGKDRQGDREKVKAICADLDISVEHLQLISAENNKISTSTAIRKMIQDGHLQEAEKWLGRPYSVFGKVEKGLGLGKKLGYRTANIPVDDLCLPPYGIYAASMRYDKVYPGVASLGIAPTVRQDNKPVLEIHLFDQPPDVSGKFVEIFFKRYMRPEIKFDSLEALSKQIALDVIEARSQ